MRLRPAAQADAAMRNLFETFDLIEETGEPYRPPLPPDPEPDDEEARR